jgi:hypothetical protein
LKIKYYEPVKCNTMVKGKICEDSVALTEYSEDNSEYQTPECERGREGDKQREGDIATQMNTGREITYRTCSDLILYLLAPTSLPQQELACSDHNYVLTYLLPCTSPIPSPFFP